MQLRSLCIKNKKNFCLALIRLEDAKYVNLFSQLQSLEDTDKSKLNSNQGSLEKQRDHVAEDEGEEGIEEEEESWGKY